MKVRCLAVLCLAALAVPVLAQDDKKPAAGMSQADMEAMVKAGTPGEQHKRLAKMAGKWKTTNKMWMAPGQPPVESTGSMEAKMIFDGRYLESTHKGDMMGQPFEGRATEAYDNVTGQFISTWIDNMGTGIMVMRGSCDAGCKTLTMTGDMIDPTTGKNCKMKEASTFVDDNTFKFEMWMDDGSGSFKMMEITGKRQ